MTYNVEACKVSATESRLNAIIEVKNDLLGRLEEVIQMENRNVIETVIHTSLTKRELIDLINKSFPDEEVGNHGQIAQLSTTTMSDGTKMQNVCFGKILKV